MCRYLILAGSDRRLMANDPKTACVRILRHAGSANDEMYQLGKTKVIRMGYWQTLWCHEACKHVSMEEVSEIPLP